MKSSPFLLAVMAGAALSTACGPATLDGDSRDGVGTSSLPIIGGTLATGDPAVVAMMVGSGSQSEQFCTGTLVAPKTVVTAAHCINAYGAGYPYFVAFGTYASSPSQGVRIIRQVKHPSYNGSAYDFGVVQLERAVTNVTPIELNPTPLTGSVGQPIRHVGYGLTDPNGQSSGVKREVTYTLRQVRQLTIESGASGKQTCGGDSGGPAFMVTSGSSVERLAGVVSYGDQDCAVEGWDGRVDAVLPWLRSTMGQWENPTCAADGACVQGCTPVDQDCACVADGVCSAQCEDVAKDPDCPRDCATNGVCSTLACPRPDADCVAVGAACAAAQVCVSRQCVTDAQHPQAYCTRGCAAPGDCPGGMECGPAGQCRYPQRPERQLYDFCSPATDFCVASVCTGPAGQLTRCVKACTGAADCGGDRCEGGGDGQRYCRPASLSFAPIYLVATPIGGGPAASSCAAVGGVPALWLGLALLPLLRRRR